MNRKRLISYIGVICVALYASNLFVFLRQDQWTAYLKPLQEAVRHTSTRGLSLRRQLGIQPSGKDVENMPETSELKAADNLSGNRHDKVVRMSAENVYKKKLMKDSKKVFDKALIDFTNTSEVNISEKRIAKDTVQRAMGIRGQMVQPEGRKSFKTFNNSRLLTFSNFNSQSGGHQHNTSVTLSPHDIHLAKLVRQHVLRRKHRFHKVVRSPTVHIGFLKVHKAFSTILQTMLFRFGHQRNLSFVLPQRGHYFSKSTSRHERLKPTVKGRSYDILCNHGYFNFSIYTSILPRDSVYIAIVREPFRQFTSSYDYYTKTFNFPYLINIPDAPMTNLILYPEKYEESWPLSYTMNSMAKDFGFQEKHYREFQPGTKPSSAHAYLENLKSIFDLVLVAEWLDESLVLMRRQLNWPMKDLLYIKKNVGSPVRRVDPELIQTFKYRNRLDYLLYDCFVDILKKKMRQGGRSLVEETDHFKRTVFRVTAWCSDQYFGEFVVSRSRWNKEFVITTRDCDLMSISELDFINSLRQV